MKRLILLTALMAAFISTPANSAQENQPDDLEKQVKTLYQEWIHSPDPANWFTRNEARLSPELAKKAEQIAEDFLRDQEFEAANQLYLFAGITHLHLRDRAGALEDLVNSMQLRLAMAKKFEQYQALTQEAFDISSKAESIRRYDLQFEAAVIAANSAYFGSQTRQGVDAEQPTADTLKDCVAVLKTIQYASNRLYLERFVSLLAAVIESATSLPFVATERAQSDVNELLKQIAQGAEQSIPSDFKYTNPKLGSPESTIETAASLADISYRFGSASSASARLTIAAQRAREAGDTDTWLRMVSIRYSGERKAGVPAVLLEKLRDDAWNSAQQLRVEYRSPAGRIWVAYRTDLLYADMLSDQLQLGAGQPAKTFAAVETLKARTLLDGIHSQSRSGVPANGEQLQSDVLGFNAPRTGKDDLLLGEMRLVSQLSPFNAGEDETVKRLKTLAELEKSYKAANLGVTEPAPIAQLRDIQAALQPHEGIIEYIMPFEQLGPANALWILFISKNEFHAVQAPLDLLSAQGIVFGRISADGEAPIDSSPLDSLVVESRVAVRGSDEKKAKAYLRNLYILLITPLSRDGVRLEDYERIAIVPHGMLHYVPFPALLDANGHFLISKTALTIVPSASIWLALLERRGPAKQFVAMGNPALEKGAVELPYSGQEMEAIAKEMASAAPKVFEGPDATKGRLAREAPAANILHLATHGLFPDDKAMDNHAIILSAGNGDDGTLTAARIRQMDLHATRLAVLSVCNGGLYRIGPADSPFGLIPAFIEAGSQNVMGTLWPLDDKFGRDFMVEFYSHLLQDGPAKAYQKTAMRFIGDDQYLRNWAGFVLVGPGRPFDAAQN